MNLLHPRTAAFFRYFMSAYPGRTLLMVLMLVVSGILEGVSVITLLPLLEAASSTGGNGQTSGVVGAVTGLLASIGLEPTLWAMVGLVVFGMTMKAVLLWLAMRQVGFTVAQVTLDLRLQLVRALLKARWSYFGGQPIGRFANTITSEALRSSAAYQEACVVLAGLVQIVVYLAISAAISWQVTIAALLTGTLFVVGLKRFVAMGRSAGDEQTELMKSLAARLVDALQGIKPMKAMGREDLFWPLLEGEAEGLNQAQRRTVIATQSLTVIQEPLVTAILGAGLVVLLSVTQNSFTTIVVLAFIFYRLMTHVRTLQMRYQIMSAGESAFWSIRKQIDDAESAVETHGGTRHPGTLEGAIEFRGVSFAYPELQVLRDVSLQIPAGRITALVGPSGSGKTTIVDLIAGLQLPDTGAVYIDDIPLSDLNIEEWRRVIGYVPQHVFLFNDTVRNNVTLGDRSISDARVIEALQDAGAWDFVSRDADGLDAVVAPQGSNYSGGQRQRLAIARALVKNPVLMILDEATTGLDAPTEAAILATMRALRGRVTILAISHQPALQQSADLVLRLEDGRVRERAGLEVGV